MSTNLAELDRSRLAPNRLDHADDSAVGLIDADHQEDLDEHAHHATHAPAESLEHGSNGEDFRFPELSERLEKDLVQVFKLLSDETRLRILLYLARERELHVTALCGKLGQSQPAVSHHLALLRVAGLIEARRDGKHNFYSVRKLHFHRIMEELFQSISDPDTEQVRFDDFVLTQESA